MESLGCWLGKTPLYKSHMQPHPTSRPTPQVVKFFASDDASYISGQILYVDGGRMALNYTVPVPDEVLDALE